MYLPLIFFGKNSFLLTNDNLNLEFLISHLLKTSGNLFNLSLTDQLPQFANGLELKYIHSPFNLVKVFFIFFESFDAYIINSVTTRLIAFFSIRLLILNYFNLNNNLQVNLISFGFASIPVYNILGITILGLPLLLWAFLNLLESKKILISLISIIFFVSYSHFHLIFPFAVFWLVILAFYKLIYQGKKIKTFLLGILVFIIFTLLFNYGIISTIFESGDSKSFRVSREFINLPTYLGMIYSFIKTIFFGDLISSLFVSIPILFLVFYQALNKKIDNIIILLILVICFNTLINSLAIHISKFFGEFLSIFSAFNFGRFIFLNSFIFFLILVYMVDKIKNKKIVLVSLTLIISLNMIRNMEFYYNSVGRIVNDDNKHFPYDEDKYLKSLVSRDLYNNDFHIHHSSGFFNFNEYYSEILFREIENYIGKSKDEFSVIHLGINPAISQYNGFYSLDAYSPNFPIKYFNIFNRINSRELSKLDDEKGINMSNKLMLISSELTKICPEFCFDLDKFKINNFEPNIDELKVQNVEYIFSAVMISNVEKLNIKFEQKFEHNDSPYTIYLYKII